VIPIFKKTKIDKNYFKIAAYSFAVLAAAILLEQILDNFGLLSQTSILFFRGFRRLISPFLFGFGIAYLINPCVTFFEKKLFGHLHSQGKTKAICRCLSILLTYLIILGSITWLLIYFIPEMTSTFTAFVSQLPEYTSGLETTVTTFFSRIDFIDGKDVNLLLERLFKPFLDKTQNIPLMLETIINQTVIAASTLFNLLMGIFIAFYMLMDKERFSYVLKRNCYSVFSQDKTTEFFRKTKQVHVIFQSFILGKTLDSFIIGVLCFIGMSLINAPYIIIISLIIGITNMIPYFGPFIGAIPAILITLLIDPGKAIWVGLFILALQQFDGIVLGPKILGDSTGMSPIWIILSIIIGGAVLGPLGMFIGVPIFASIKLFFQESMDKRFQEKYTDSNKFPPL